MTPRSQVHNAPSRRFQRAHLGMSPPALLASSFAVLIVIGTVALKLPFATLIPISWHQALFTAVSAVTVTGLAVVDTATEFSFWGQLIIAILIQCGGVGLMTFAVITAVSLGWRISLKNQLRARAALNQTNLSQIAHTATAVILLTLTVEAIGLVIMTLDWWPQLGFWQALWHGTFYAISAFNNAGFALASSSLTDFAGDPMVNFSITSLYIVGGLGFTVLAELWQWRRGHKLSLYTRMMLRGTVVINLIAMLLFALLEWHNPGTLGSLHSLSAKLWASWLQGTTTRTAGFNSVDLSQLTDASSLLMILLMFIGGGANSTASGIKLSTFIVLLVATSAFLRRRKSPNLHDRAIGQDTIYKAMAITVIALVILFFAIFLLCITEQANFLDVVFEAVSAMSTVGVSRGLTTELSGNGQTIIMLLMFVGRVGPLTMAYLLTAPRPQLTRYPEIELQVG